MWGIHWPNLFFRWHAGVDKWLNNQIQASRLVPQQYDGILFHQGLQDIFVELYQIFQDKARLLGCSFWLGISGTTVDTGLRLLSDPHILL